MGPPNETTPPRERTHCPYCAFQCAMRLVPSPRAIIGDPTYPTSAGNLCVKGWSAAAPLDHPDRLRTPLVRGDDGHLAPATWDEALDRVASGLARARATHGADSVGVFGSGSLTNEKAYLLGKFARVALGTSSIDYNGRFCMSSAAAAQLRAFGIDRGLPFPIADARDAEVILLVGANVAETMPPILEHLAPERRGGGDLVVVDPRRSETARRGTIHLAVAPGTDAALANGILHVLVREGWIDAHYVRDRTVGWEDAKAVAMSHWPERVERITGVPEALIVGVARRLARARSAMILTGRGPEQQSNGVDNVLAWTNVALALGLPGRPSSGFGCLTGQANGQGGREHGQKADQLPGYRRIDDPEARAHVARVWGIDPALLPGAGRSACELFDALGTSVRALFVVGSNPVVSAPRALHVEARLRELDLLVVSDFFLSETARLAHVVLPSAQWAEEDGTITNLEGRVLRRRKRLEPPEGTRTDLAILCAVAARLGKGAAFASSDPRDVFDELRRASAGGAADYFGITYERIDAEDGVFWPCPSLDRPGTPRLFADRFATPDGRARFHATPHRGPAEQPDAEYPLLLTTGRVLAQYQSGTQTRRTPRLAELAPRAVAEIHPTTARRFGIVSGDEVVLATRRGRSRALAVVTSDIRPDTVFVPFHFAGEEAVNRLTNGALDPVSRMPELKVCAARIAKAEEEGETS